MNKPLKFLMAVSFCLVAPPGLATAQYSCAPWDGMAFMVHLPDSLHLSIWQPEKMDEWMEFSSQNGSLMRCPANPDINHPCTEIKGKYKFQLVKSMKEAAAGGRREEGDKGKNKPQQTETIHLWGVIVMEGGATINFDEPLVKGKREFCG